jgi:ribose transport system substrate-binding protein
MVDKRIHSERPKRIVNRRSYLKLAGTAGLAGLAGCAGGDGAGDDGSGGGSSGGSGGDGGSNGGTATATPTPTTTAAAATEWHLGISILGTQDIWLESLARSAQWYAQDRDDIRITVANAQVDVSKQVQDGLSLINSGVDGIVLSPLDSQTTARVADAAEEEDIAFFNTDSNTISPNVDFWVGFSNFEGAALAGEQMIKALEAQHGEPRGNILTVNGPLSSSILVERRDGFMSVMDQYDDVNVVQQINTDATESQAVQKVTSFLRTNQDIHGVYAPILTTASGALSAIERMDMKHKQGEEGHVAFVTIDANERLLEAITDNFVDFAILDTPLFFNPIAMSYMVDFLEAGQDPSVLPEIGTTVTADDLTIEPADHVGVTVWEEPVWAPANIIPFEQDGETLYPNFQIGGTVVDETNADEPFLWPNVAANF